MCLNIALAIAIAVSGHGPFELSGGYRLTACLLFSELGLRHFILRCFEGVEAARRGFVA